MKNDFENREPWKPLVSDDELKTNDGKLIRDKYEKTILMIFADITATYKEYRHFGKDEAFGVADVANIIRRHWGQKSGYVRF